MKVIVVGQNWPASAGIKTPSLGRATARRWKLTDNCDALVVCVSEERGSVSLVNGDHLETFDAEDKLVAALASHGVGAVATAARQDALPSFARQLLPTAESSRWSSSAGRDRARPLACGRARRAASRSMSPRASPLNPPRFSTSR